MKLTAFLGDEERALEVRPAPRGYVVAIDGVETEVDVAVVEPDTYSLLVGGLSYDVSVHDEGRDGYVVRRGGFARRLRIVNPLSVTAGAHAVPEGPVPALAVLAGRVVKLLVAPGDEVREGQPLLVLEAMKMENDILAPKAGPVREILVAAGQAVESGEKLAIVG